MEICTLTLADGENLPSAEYTHLCVTLLDCDSICFAHAAHSQDSAFWTLEEDGKRPDLQQACFWGSWSEYKLV
jgi:hypothetical protein